MMGLKRSIAILSLLLMFSMSNAEKSASEFGRRGRRRRSGRRRKAKPHNWKSFAGGAVAGVAVSGMLRGRRSRSYGYRRPSYGYRRPYRRAQAHGGHQAKPSDMKRKYETLARAKAMQMKRQTCGQTPEQCKFNMPVKYIGNAEERMKICLSFKDKKGNYCCMSQRFIYYGVDSCVPLNKGIQKRQALLGKLRRAVMKQVKAGNVGKGTRQPVDVLGKAADQSEQNNEAADQSEQNDEAADQSEQNDEAADQPEQWHSTHQNVYKRL